MCVVLCLPRLRKRGAALPYPDRGATPYRSCLQELDCFECLLDIGYLVLQAGRFPLHVRLHPLVLPVREAYCQPTSLPLSFSSPHSFKRPSVSPPPNPSQQPSWGYNEGPPFVLQEQACAGPGLRTAHTQGRRRRRRQGPRLISADSRNHLLEVSQRGFDIGAGGHIVLDLVDKGCERYASRVGGGIFSRPV